MSAMSKALRRALARPANGVRLRLRRYCHSLRKPHYIFTTREAAENALFTWGMAMRDCGSRTHNLLTVFGCGDHWHLGRQRFGKSGNSEAKTEFRLHKYERTALLRDVAAGVHAPARAGVDVPSNRGGAEHLRENGHGVARGARPTPATKGKTPSKEARLSIRERSGRS